MWFSIVPCTGLLSIYSNSIIVVFHRMFERRPLMPNCQKCGKRWSWSQTLKVNFIFDGMECPNCGKKQYVTSKSKKGLKRLSYLPVILILFLLFDFSLKITIGIIIIASILMIGFYPFLIKLNSDDERVY